MMLLFFTLTASTPLGTEGWWEAKGLPRARCKKCKKCKICKKIEPQFFNILRIKLQKINENLKESIDCLHFDWQNIEKAIVFLFFLHILHPQAQDFGGGWWAKGLPRARCNKCKKCKRCTKKNKKTKVVSTYCK